MIYQTDAEFTVYPQIGHGACYFLSILRALSDHFGKPFTHDGVLAFYSQELADGDTDVDNEMFVGDPQGLIDDYIGKGLVNFLGAKDALYIASPGELAFGVWHRIGTDFNHFTWGTDPHKDPFYDPWASYGSLSVAQGHLVGQRIAAIL